MPDLFNAHNGLCYAWFVHRLQRAMLCSICLPILSAFSSIVQDFPVVAGKIQVMKLIIAIVRDEDSEAISNALVGAGFRVTRIASTGGFLRRGSTTLMIGVEEGMVDQAIQIVRECCAPVVETGIRRATLFVLNVDRFTQV